MVLLPRYFEATGNSSQRCSRANDCLFYQGFPELWHPGLACGNPPFPQVRLGCHSPPVWCKTKGMRDPAEPALPATAAVRPGLPATPSEAAARGYRAAADAPATLRAYRADLACYQAWCAREV
jgi:hypothetical protein